METTTQFSVHSSIRNPTQPPMSMELHMDVHNCLLMQGEKDELALVHLFQDLNALTVAQLVLIRSLFPPK